MSFRFLTAGESHGKSLLGILEGIPAGLELKLEYLHAHLQRRKLGYGRGARQKIETDEVEILTGIRFGKTLGSPLGLQMLNRDWQVWQKIMQVEPMDEAAAPLPGLGLREVHVPRPGHADWIGGLKYGHRDMRNVLERSSARETAMRVALGTVARKLLEDLNIQIASRVVRIGSAADSSAEPPPLNTLNARADASPVRCTDPASEGEMIAEVERAKKAGDTLGGEFEVYASGVPVGLGSYVQWDRRLEGDIARAMMSLNAIKGVEIGLGFRAAQLPGSRFVFGPR
jgi:chorismate synthase